MSRALSWLGIAAGVLAGGLVLEAVGLPSSHLLAALLVGLAVALARPGSRAVSTGTFRASQAVAGVSLGAYLEADSLAALGSSWPAVAVVSLATLGLSIAAGIVLARTTRLDPATAALGTIAGGASGIVGMADELGADDRIVAFMQYLRVLVVVLATPLAIALFFGGQNVAGAADLASATLLGEPLDWVWTAGIAATGALAARRLRITAGTLLGPMVLTGALVLGGVLEGFAPPELATQAAFSLIGLQVGLNFTLETVRRLRSLLAPTLAMIAFLIVSCLGLAAALTATTDATFLDSYLATTPGGLYAVLAVAFGAGADTTFVIAVQALRVVAMVLLAPLAVRWTLGRLRPASAGGDSERVP